MSSEPISTSRYDVGGVWLFLCKIDNHIMLNRSVRLSLVAFLRLDGEPGFLKQPTHFIPKVVIRCEDGRVISYKLFVLE